MNRWNTVVSAGSAVRRRCTQYIRGNDSENSGRSDRGSAALFFLLMTVVLLAVAGLAIDGGSVINAKDRAYDVSEQAARAAANRIDVGTLRASGQVVLDRASATQAASNFVAGTGYAFQGVSFGAGQSVTVTVSRVERTALLGLIPGLGQFTVTGSATATPVTGINGGTGP